MGQVISRFQQIRRLPDTVVPSGQPAELHTITTAALSTNPTTLNYFDGYLWGVDGSNRINRSADWGATWTVMNTPGLTPSYIHIAPCDDGELILVTSTKVHKSSGWPADPSTATWVQKASTTSANVSFLPMGFDYDEVNRTKFIVTEYSALEYRSESRKGIISIDGGDTWETKYDSLTEHGSTFNDASHLHGCCYDRWLNNGLGGFWISDAHNVADSKDPSLPAALYYSDENGENWTKQTGECGDPLPTTLTATEYGLVMGSDTIPAGIYILPRENIATADAYRADEWIPEVNQPSIIGFADCKFRDPDTGIVYVGFGSNYPGDIAPVIMASDGISAGIVYTGELTDQGVFFMVAAKGHLAATVRLADTSWRRMDALTRPIFKAPSVAEADSGNILRGRNLSQLGQGSCTTGRRSTATGDFAVTVGEDSNCTHDDSTVVGANLDSTDDDQFQIGAKHIEQAVVSDSGTPGSGKGRMEWRTNGGVATLYAKNATSSEQVFPYAMPASAFADLPAASSAPYSWRYCIDEAGGGVPVFSDGANWRRVTDRAIATAFSGLILDLYTAYGAWSFEDIGPTSYSGATARVRRSSDDVEADISGFGATFKTNAETHTSSNDGFIRRWHDRSGNGFHLEMPTDAQQPKIVTAGTTNVVGSLTAATFLDSGLEDAFTLAQPYTIFVVLRAGAYDATETAGLNNIIDGGTTPGSMVVRRDNATTGTAFGGATMTSTYPIANSELLLMTLVADGTNSKIYKDGTVHASGSFGTNEPGGLALGFQTGGSRFGNMDAQCVLLFDYTMADADIDYINAYLIDLYGVS